MKNMGREHITGIKIPHILTFKLTDALWTQVREHITFISGSGSLAGSIEGCPTR